MGIFMYLMSQTKGKEEINVSIFCSLCEKEIDSGYLCREKELVLCENCQREFNMSRCHHERGEHMHIAWPGKKNKNEDAAEEAIAISNKRQRRNESRKN